MGAEEKARNEFEDKVGAAKEAAGKLTGDQDLEKEGQKDQAKASLKEAAEKAKDVAGDIGANIRNAAQKLKEGFSKDKE